MSVLLTNILSMLLFLSFAACSKQKENSYIKKGQVIPLGKQVSTLDTSIMVIFQDSKKIYWFGSKNNGVYQYHQDMLFQFTTKDGLCSNHIMGIQEDKLGNLFFDTSSGVSKYDGQSFTNLKIIDPPNSKHNWILQPDDLWFRMGTNKSGPYRYDGEYLYHLSFPKTDQEAIFRATYPSVSFNPYGIYTIYQDQQQHLWFGTASLGFCRFDGKQHRWLYENHLTETPSGGDFGFRSVIEDEEGYFRFCNARYRYKILPDITEKQETNYLNYNKEKRLGKFGNVQETDFPYFLSIAVGPKGYLWMLTYDDGVWCDRGNGLIHYPVKKDGKQVLLFSIYKDRQGILWLGTHNDGVYQLKNDRFEPFKI